MPDMKLNDAMQVIAYAAELLDKESDRLATTSPRELIQHLADVRRVYDKLGDVKKLINSVEDRLSRQLVPDIMRRDGIKTINLDGIGRVSLGHRYSCSIIDKPRGFTYLRDNKAGSLIQETVNSSSLAAYSKNLLEGEGRELPADIFKTSTMTYTSITKAK